MSIIKNLHGVPVFESSRGLDFALKAAEVGGVVGPRWPNQLDGTGLLEQRVLGQIDFSHPAGPQVLLQPSREATSSVV
jgi:hypothetical protein